jgi:hypothetical protein
MKTKAKFGKLEGILLFIGFVVAGRIIGGCSGESTAIKHRMKAANNAAIKAGVPNEFLGVKWLSTIESVKQSHPNAMRTNSKYSGQRLETKSVFYGRPAIIAFEFNNRALEEVQIEFTDDLSATSFQSAQTQAGIDFGPLPPASNKTPFTFYSELQKEEFIIVHSLGGYGTPKERLSIKLTRWPD